MDRFFGISPIFFKIGDRPSLWPIGLKIGDRPSLIVQNSTIQIFFVQIEVNAFNIIKNFSCFDIRWMKKVVASQTYLMMIGSLMCFKRVLWTTMNDNNFYNKDGTIRKVKRDDYSRGKKRTKHQNPWELNWLILYADPTTNEMIPQVEMGKNFAESFVFPFQFFKKL